ncbi:isochorismatase family protein [Ideonella sp. A 288]|uniref:isochorismatase family protein n=1 Tax=Ideonella sp. A 288 TaxID=1962181 RepID=UPI000B4BD94A|nr:isochorismatase family protein [Ideonella sp. A 288]
MTTDLIAPDPAALVLVDYQQRLMPAIADHPRVLAEAQRLADAAQVLGMRTVGTEQNPRGLGANVASLRERCETTLAKMHFDACADGLLDLVEASAAGRSRELVVAGCEAHVCLMQTALGLRRAGWRVWVVAPACGSRNAGDHALAMARMRDAGIGIASTEMVVFEWLRSCQHARFKAVLPVLKGA